MYVVCVCMYVVIFAKLITVSTYIDVFPWDLTQWSLGTVTKMWGQRSSRGQWPQVLAFNVSTYFWFSWDLDKMILAHPPSISNFVDSFHKELEWKKVKQFYYILGRFKKQMWGQHLGVNDLWFKFLQKGSLYPHTLMYFHRTWTQWSLGRVTHVTSTDVGSKVI